MHLIAMDGHRKVFRVLHAYLDDSGTHEDSPIVVIAGYFGSERHWLRFDREWRKILEEEQLGACPSNPVYSDLRVVSY